ncbi:MAG: alpha/beta hydrolase [Pseudorhodoplanes sp.]
MPGTLIPVQETVAGASRVTVLAASTRQKSTDASEMFGAGRAEGLSYATVEVSIPPDIQRKVGQVQRPATPPGNPQREFVTLSRDYLDRQAFVSALTRMAKESKRTKVVVFVHGFNNRFDDAVYRLAQIVHDSNVAVIPVLFTWPSRGEVALRAYTYDRESANYSRDAFGDVLDLLNQNPAITEVNILAHSMGNWIVLEALRTRALRAKRGPDKIKNAMLVAPDVDVDVFQQQLRTIGTSPRLELFVSRDDKALGLSGFIWGGVPRVGEVDPDQEPYRTEFQRARIEVFDLSDLNARSAHSKAFENAGSVAAMLRQRLRDGQQMTETASAIVP